MRLYFTTVIRAAPPERSGVIVGMDWDAKRVEAMLPISPRDPEPVDPNPRGSTRGGRGITRVGEALVVGSFHTLYRFTPELEPLGAASGGLLAGIHAVYPARDGSSVWVAATNIDAALRVDPVSGEVLEQRWPRELPGLQRELGVHPLRIDKAADNRCRFLAVEALAAPDHLHLNAVRSIDGRVLGLLHAPGVIADLDAGRVVVRHPTLRGAHDLLPMADGTIAVNDTRGAQVRFFVLDRAGGGRLVRSIDLRAIGWVRALAAGARTPGRAARVTRRVLQRPVAARPLFVRGLATGQGRLYVGLSPASVLELDLATGDLVSAYQHSAHVAEAVHGIHLEG